MASCVKNACFRRGGVRHLECRAIENAKCLEWQLLPNVGAYVQVSDGSKLEGPVMVRRHSERPIRVGGEFSDQELVSLVLFIRSRPKDESISAMGVSGTHPIMAIEKQNNGSVWVRMSEDGGSGELATVRRVGRRWRLTDFGVFVAANRPLQPTSGPAQRADSKEP